MLQYSAIDGQSVYDVCLATYGTIDYLGKLLQDNSIESIDSDVISGQQFIWDETLTKDQAVNKRLVNSNLTYATKYDPNRQQISVIKDENTGISVPTDDIIQPPVTPPNMATFPMFVGTVDNLNPTEDQIKFLTEILGSAGKRNITFKYSINSGRFCFAYPDNYGSLSSILDTTGYEIKSGFVVTNVLMTIEGITQLYRVYTLIYPTTVLYFDVTYKF